jgi:hypothetical protein
VKGRVIALKAMPLNKRQPRRTGFLGLYGPKMDPVEYETQKLEELYGLIRERQANIYNRKEVRHMPFLRILILFIEEDSLLKSWCPRYSAGWPLRS